MPSPCSTHSWGPTVSCLLFSGLQSPDCHSSWFAVPGAHGRRDASAKGRRVPKTKGKLHPGMREACNRHYHRLRGFHRWWNRLWGGEQGENQHLLEHLPNTRHSYMHDGTGLIEARTSQVRWHTSLKRKPVLRWHMLACWLPGQLKQWQPILLQMASTLVFNLREQPYWTRGQRHRNITWGVRYEHGSGNSGVAWACTGHLGPCQALWEEQTVLKQTTIDEPILKAR